MATDRGSLEDRNLTKALQYLNSILVQGESIDAWAIQHRLFALTHRRNLIAATSGRFIKITRGIFGGFEVIDFRWQDLGDTKIKVGIIGADIFLKTFGSTDLAINKNSDGALFLKGFTKQQAQHIYRLAQSQDQSWREKRRVRELEELRAKSGGFNMGHSSGTHHIENSSENVVSKMQLAKEMLENKLITDSEYETIKARLLNGL